MPLRCKVNRLEVKENLKAGDSEISPTKTQVTAMLKGKRSVCERRPMAETCPQLPAVSFPGASQVLLESLTHLPPIHHLEGLREAVA
jgi:hypothetical protein